MAGQRPRIVLAEAYAEDAVARLRAVGDVVDVVGADLQALRDALHDADALLVRTYVRVTPELLDAAPKLRVIARGGVGLDNIDVSAAMDRGIKVVYTPAASTRSVAEHTWGLILAVERHIVAGDAAIRCDAFMASRNAMRLRELGELTLGVIGMGRIGSAVARIAATAFGMRVLSNDIIDVGPFDFPLTSVNKTRLYQESDIITLHVPLTRQTRGLIAADALAACRPTTTLINTSRGPVVDTHALAQALADGKLGGAGLDVFEDEPIPAGHPLLAAPNAVLTPHVAGRSAAALGRMNDVVDDVIAVLAGKTPRYVASSSEG
ncbi:MAG: hydroxyacid dehydrogenase [Phycisphaerales bacterium]|nr:hydroxyacid dehydrogenase [Phycisphaerales bacterium]